MKHSRLDDTWNYMKKHYALYLMLLLPVLYFIIFKYLPLGGLLIAFKDYKIRLGIWKSPWVGFDNFKFIFKMSRFWRATRNTIMLNLLSLLFEFPAAILFALFLNEIRTGLFKKGVQTIVYLPHFVSWVIIGGIVTQVFATESGLVNIFLDAIGLEKIPFLAENGPWITTYVTVGVWQSIGWSAIVYISAISGIDQAQYEAARIDGCSRFKTMFKITLPNIFPTIVIMLILRVGKMVTIGLEKPMMLETPLVTEVSSVLSTYSYAVGIQQGKYDIAIAIGLFQSLINFLLVVLANKISAKLSDESLW